MRVRTARTVQGNGRRRAWAHGDESIKEGREFDGLPLTIKENWGVPNR